MDYIYDSQSMYHHPTSLYPAQSGFAPSPSAFASFYLNSGHYPSSGYFGQMSPSSPACYEGNSSQNNSLNSSQANKLPIMTNQRCPESNTLTPPSSSSSSSSTCSSTSEYSTRHSTAANFQPYLSSPISQYSANSQFFNSSSPYASYLSSAGIEPHFTNRPAKLDKESIKTKTDSVCGAKQSPEKRTGLFITPSLMSIEACQRRKRRQRTQFSKLQLNELEKLFQMTRYPDIYCREDLSARISIPESRIQVWFKNRRSKIRKDEKCEYRIPSLGYESVEFSDTGNGQLEEDESYENDQE